VIQRGLEKNKELINKKILETKTYDFNNIQNDNHGSDEGDEAL
jgi:hypothetical protein